MIKTTTLHRTHKLTLLFLVCFSLHTYAQLCEGSLGDPVIEINFGSGSGRGNALGSDITAFTYSASGTLDEGEYTIANTTSGLKDNAWHATTDHTGNSNGYMMVINSAVIANEGVFYTYTVTGLCANTTFEFSAWLMNIMNPTAGTDEYHPDVTFRISDTSGNILGSYNTGDIAQSSSGNWQQYGFYFTLGAETEVTITILNSAPSAHPGNDIALDDITFKPCGPTITNAIDNETGTNLSICEDENISYTLQSTVSSGYTDPQYQWQYSEDSGVNWSDIIGATTTEYIFNTTDTPGLFLYRLSVANGTNINALTCRITSESYSIQIIEIPEALTGVSEQVFCTTQNPTINDIEISNVAIWYDAETNGNIVEASTNLIDGTTYYAASENLSGCQSDDRLPILVTIVAPSLALNNVSSIICDTANDNYEYIDLTEYETQITNCTDCLFSYFTSNSDAQNDSENGKIATPTDFEWTLDTDTIYVRIDSADNCYQIAEITLSLVETPIINIDDNVAICTNANYVTINAGYGFSNYLWSTGETSQSITVTNDSYGDYWVSVTEDYDTHFCSSTKYFEVVQSNSAVISSIDTIDWTVDNNSIIINLSDASLGDYEYSLDDINYQDSNRFNHLNSGEYTVFIKDKNGCGVIEEEVYLLNYPKFFTPNGDGHNDVWFIRHASEEPNMTIKIFNRYGKILTHLNSLSFWDGTYNGNPLPTSDYWFTVTRENGKTYTGHFTLKR
ncbi:T9SS type B sorting domain-containing protein [Winogradskyella vidalii]|uniref:T9SS type B sorting domain-containing protein n=1 Tax=Winogradskyella vidalii TaxID=2615024 RepID=UPI0015CC7F74|nr:T9SS type B sorting domain-containing protein [Winogradskyella vidalii]